jgi:hypothetical protein
VQWKITDLTDLTDPAFYSYDKNAGLGSAAGVLEYRSLSPIGRP